jgi:phospholipid/cholesterol/gamma-HCH transport system ATP-binding protein
MPFNKPGNTVAIEAKGLEFCTQAKTLVKTLISPLSLSVKTGERIAIMGPSGAGKSLLLKLLAGLIAPTQGELWIQEKDFHACGSQAKQQLRLKMGLLFQKNALFDSLSNLENVMFPLRETTSLSALEIRAKSEHFLEAVGLQAVMSLNPSEISGGMQKRLGIARALALSPEILFYDDPTAGLDPITSRKIVDLILKVRAETNSTILAVTNEINRGFQLADRIWLIFSGQLIDVGSPEQAHKNLDPRVQQFIFGQTQGPLTEIA